jgi:hypothetical protein
MSVNPNGGRRFEPASLTVYHDRLSRKISASHEPHAWNGFEVSDGILPDGSISQVVMVGPKRLDDDKRPDKKSIAIPLSSERGSDPRIGTDGKVYQGSIKESDEGLVLVRQQREGFATRIFHTGLIRPKQVRNEKEAQGYRQRDLASLRVDGIKPAYHGIFPLELGSAQIGVTGETVEVMAIADVYDLTNPNESRFRGLDVPHYREMAAEIPKGGAIIDGDLEFLTIHERLASGEIKIYDVTNDKTMWDLFNSYARADLERRMAERAAKGGTSKADQPELPADHPDR